MHTLKSIQSIPQMQNYARQARTLGLSIGFIPTMGALHEGHLSLIQKAKTMCDVIVVSIFVNPLQFGPQEDFAAYPRNLERDQALVLSAGGHVVFAPQATELYPAGFQTTIKAGILGEILCGHTRPGHFDGVLTVVLKLFSIVAPSVAIFGEKDFQQLTLIRQLVKDFHLDIEIIGAPIDREISGLARSSRNGYLNDAEKKGAATLQKALSAIDSAYQQGQKECPALLNLGKSIIEKEALLRLDYLQILKASDLSEHTLVQSPSRVLISAWCGKTRLIDNIELQ